MTTIRVSDQTIRLLRMRKAALGDKTYDETLSHLLEG